MFLRIGLFFCVFLTTVSYTFASVDEEVPIILREPAANSKVLFPEARARVEVVADNKTVKAITVFNDWQIGEVVGIESQTAGVGIIGFLEVQTVENKQDGTYELTLELLRQSRINFIQIGDQVVHLDLTTTNQKYRGTTDLIVKRSNHSISAKYKPLFYQGVSVGETAQTLWEDEYMITWYGQVSYGWKDWLTLSTVVPFDFVGAPNANVKARVFESFSNVASIGLNFAKPLHETRSTLNLNFYWDSVSSESMIGHTLLSVALLSFEDAEDVTAIKSLGTSSLQSGYEFILSHWDRVLVGPSYNFESEAVGGFLTYVKIWDKFHISASVHSINIASFKYSVSEGYYLGADAYWRF